MDTQLIVDLKTTGLDPATSGVVEIAVVLIQDGEIAGDWSSLVWPGRHNLTRRHRDVLRVSRITIEEILDAPEIPDAANQLLGWIGGMGIRVRALATSYNAAFDRSFLARHTSRWLDWTDCLMLRAMDVMGLAGALVERHDGTWKYPRLGEAARHFGIAANTTHRALADARTAAAIYLAMEKERGEKIRKHLLYRDPTEIARRLKRQKST